MINQNYCTMKVSYWFRNRFRKQKTERQHQTKLEDPNMPQSAEQEQRKDDGESFLFI